MKYLTAYPMYPEGQSMEFTCPQCGKELKGSTNIVAHFQPYAVTAINTAHTQAAKDAKMYWRAEMIATTDRIGIDYLKMQCDRENNNRGTHAR